MRRVLAVPAVALASLVLQGCLIIPLPPKDRFTEEEIASLEVGRTTRAEVIERLGPPSTIWETERVFGYERGTWGALWIVAGGGAAVGGHVPANRPGGGCALLLQFDVHERVSRLKTRNAVFAPPCGALMTDWIESAHGEQEGPTP